MPAKGNVQLLLTGIVEGWPRHRRHLERSLRDAGISVEDEGSSDLTLNPAVPVKQLATFKRGVSRPLSPMLRERFKFASSIDRAGQVWLGAKEVATATKSLGIRRHHKSRREQWEGSAPMRFEDSDLSLFGVSPESPEDVVYLVWRPGVTEPELWNYHGMSERKFKNLESYLRWCR